MSEVRGGSCGASSTRMERLCLSFEVLIITASLSSWLDASNGWATGEASECTSFRTDARVGDRRDATMLLPLLLGVASGVALSSFSPASTFVCASAFCSSTARSTWLCIARKGCSRSCWSEGRLCGSFCRLRLRGGGRTDHCCTKSLHCGEKPAGSWGTTTRSMENRNSQ